MSYLTFNEAVGGNNTKIRGLPEEDEASTLDLMDQMPLKDTWVLWEQAVPSDTKGGGGSSYSDATKQIVEFNTAQDFWRIWNGVPQPSALLNNCRFIRENPGQQPAAIDAVMLFKKGVRPEWEDPKNQSGGHFQVQLKPNIGGAQIDEYWNNLVLAMVGGTLEPYDMITGVRLVDKLAGAKAAGVLRIELWFSRYDAAQAWGELKKNMEKAMGQRLDGSTSVPVKCETKGHSTHGKH
eukprot:TRINITY_DN110835_c0_g1_i1.p1 TRINITY_DN110835_c0_g1~~TRINITY_DN110835_c0_g1_i1.p1  ORF type:complete len:266 (+),score=59.08 TRINITY_DN110835_c0_g1_i1:90-800(+)